MLLGSGAILPQKRGDLRSRFNTLNHNLEKMPKWFCCFHCFLFTYRKEQEKNVFNKERSVRAMENAQCDLFLQIPWCVFVTQKKTKERSQRKSQHFWDGYQNIQAPDVIPGGHSHGFNIIREHRDSRTFLLGMLSTGDSSIFDMICQKD